MPKSDWEEIVSADDDVVGGELLSWAELNDLWDEHQTILDNCSVIRDVLEHCSSAFVEKEEWDAGAPGRSGLWHRISTNDPEALKTELRERIEELVHPKPTQPPQVVSGGRGPRTISDLISYLESKATAGALKYRSYPAAQIQAHTSGRLRVQAKKLSDHILNPAGAIPILEELVAWSEVSDIRPAIRELLRGLQVS